MLHLPFTILVVDDDEDEHFLIELALQRKPGTYRLRTAGTGQQALDMLESSEVLPDLVLLDVNMPGLSGFNVLRQLRANPRYDSLPVVIHTTSTASIDQEKAARLGATAFLVKSDSYQNLRDLISWLQLSWHDWHRLSDNRLN